MIQLDIDRYMESYKWSHWSFIWALVSQNKNILEHSYLVTNMDTNKYEICIEANQDFLFFRLDEEIPYRVLLDKGLRINVTMKDHIYNSHVFHKTLWTLYRFDQRAKNNVMQTTLVTEYVLKGGGGAYDDIINLYPRKEKQVDKNAITMFDADEEDTEWEPLELDYDNPQEIFMWSLQPDFGERDWEILTERGYPILDVDCGIWLGITQYGTPWGWIPELVHDLLELPEHMQLRYMEYDRLIWFINLLTKNN